MIAALFVQKNGAYFGMDGVDPWDEERDARRYDGPHPVIAHPPCTRWCMLAGLVEARYGHKKGDDGDCFASALESLRKYGGVLEHPAYSAAWREHGLNHPPSRGWANADFGGLWTCHIEQGKYGCRARKATWLLACKADLPSLRWGRDPHGSHEAMVSFCKNN